MKRLISLTTLSLLLASCSSQNPTPQIYEVTRIVEVTQVATPEITPTPNAAHMSFPAECLTPEPGVDYSLYSMHNIDMIGWCSFVEPLPMAATLLIQRDRGPVHIHWGAAISLVAADQGGQCRKMERTRALLESGRIPPMPKGKGLRTCGREQQNLTGRCSAIGPQVFKP